MKFKQEYVGTPQTAGFWQTTFKFNDGITFSLIGKRKQIAKNAIIEHYANYKFQRDSWNELEELFGDEKLWKADR